MDYSKIKLDNERNSHVTKRLNRLNAWKFFKVIYRENIWRMFGFNFLMLFCFAPMFVMMFLGSFRHTEIQQTLPMLNGFGFSTGAWMNVSDQLALEMRQANVFTGWLTVASSILVTLVLSGGFAVIRDAFWTGKLSKVGVFKSMWLGFKANIAYAFVSTAIISLMVFGIYAFYLFVSPIILAVAIVFTILFAIIALFVVMYLLTLCSVTVTYKQSIKQNLSDSWRLMWLNILPNILTTLIAVVPFALYFLLQGTGLQQLLLIVLIMFGGLYFPLVWQTHMMKTFALFHPVEVKKKRQARDGATEVEEYPTEESAPSKSKKGKKAKVNKGEQNATADVNEESLGEVDQEAMQEEVEESPATDTIVESEADAYAQDEQDAYATQDEPQD